MSIRNWPTVLRWVDQGAGIINLAWNSPSPVTFAQTGNCRRTCCSPRLNPRTGRAFLVHRRSRIIFHKFSGNPIPAQFQTGEVKIYEPPEIILDQSKTSAKGSCLYLSFCRRQPATADFPLDLSSGDTTSKRSALLLHHPADAGLYTLLATDHVGCTDQKSIELIVSDKPCCSFPWNGHAGMHIGDVLDADQGWPS